MVCVLYFFQGFTGETQDEPNCFEISQNVDAIRFRDFLMQFPLKNNGQFHFRFMMPDKRMGFSWLDITDPEQIIPTQDGFIRTKVLRLDQLPKQKVVRLQLKNRMESMKKVCNTNNETRTSVSPNTNEDKNSDQLPTNKSDISNFQQKANQNFASNSSVSPKPSNLDTNNSEFQSSLKRKSQLSPTQGQQTPNQTQQNRATKINSASENPVSKQFDKQKREDQNKPNSVDQKQSQPSQPSQQQQDVKLVDCQETNDQSEKTTTSNTQANNLSLDSFLYGDSETQQNSRDDKNEQQQKQSQDKLQNEQSLIKENNPIGHRHSKSTSLLDFTSQSKPSQPKPSQTAFQNNNLLDPFSQNSNSSLERMQNTVNGDDPDNNQDDPFKEHRKQIKGVSITADTTGKSKEVAEAMTKRYQDLLEKQAEAVKQVHERLVQNAKEQEEFDELRKRLGPGLKSWAEDHGQPKPIRSLLANMHTVMWSDSDWKPISMADVIQPNKIRKYYHLGCRATHPDKNMQRTPEQRYIAKVVFTALNEAYQKFEAEGSN